MILTKEQQAQKYAEKIAGNTCMAPVIAETWLAGYTVAEQSMWRSVEEELPEEGQAIIIRVVHKDVKSGKIFESYFNTFYFEQYFGYFLRIC